MSLVGLDIGYSAVKIAHGDGRNPALLQLPVGAAPTDRCGLTIGGESATAGAHQVLIDGAEWVAGIDPGRLSGWVQAMDDSYVTTPEYRALFYAALSAVGKDKIKVLVTGLPVSHFQNEAMRNSLKTMMTGRHAIREGFVVDVEQVVVVPQPAGAFSAHMVDAASGPLPYRIERGRSVLVVDPGHYSLDWIIYQGNFRLESSGSTSEAGEAVVRAAAAALSEQYGVKVRPVRLQEAILAGEATVTIGRHIIPYMQAMRSAAADIISRSMKTIRGSIRQVMDQRGVDLVLVAGGGAELFEAPLRDVLSEAAVTRVSNPLMANARGFYIYALQQASAAAAA